MNTGIPMDLLQLAGHRRALAEALMDGIDGDNLEALAAIEGEYQNAEAESAEEAIPYLTDLAKTEDALRAEIAGQVLRGQTATTAPLPCRGFTALQPRCGSPRAFMRKFALCRLCFRALALHGDVAGVIKSSW